jgi:hypothetical protein
MDAKNAPTGTWKTAEDAVSHSAHTHHRPGERKPEELALNHVPHTKFLTLPPHQYRIQVFELGLLNRCHCL